MSTKDHHVKLYQMLWTNLEKFISLFATIIWKQGIISEKVFQADKFMFQVKGPHPYSSCHAKRRFDDIFLTHSPTPDKVKCGN